MFVVNGRKLLLVVGTCLLMGQVVSACKKKSKHQGGAQVAPKTEPEKQDTKFGQEIVEGDSKVFRDADKQFWIKANPYTVSTNQAVNFEGACGQANAGSLGWQFGEPEAKAFTGFSTTYSYKKAGTYTVVGTCAVGGRQQVGRVTINVTDSGTGLISPSQNSPTQNSQCTTPPCTPNNGGGSSPSYRYGYGNNGSNDLNRSPSNPQNGGNNPYYR